MPLVFGERRRQRRHPHQPGHDDEEIPLATAVSISVVPFSDFSRSNAVRTRLIAAPNRGRRSDWYATA